MNNEMLAVKFDEVYEEDLGMDFMRGQYVDYYASFFTLTERLVINTTNTCDYNAFMCLYPKKYETVFEESCGDNDTKHYTDVVQLKDQNFAVLEHGN